MGNIKKIGCTIAVIVIVAINLYNETNMAKNQEIDNADIEALAYETEFFYCCSYKDDKGTSFVEGSSYTKNGFTHWREEVCVKKGKEVTCALDAKTFRDFHDSWHEAANCECYKYRPQEHKHNKQ